MTTALLGVCTATAQSSLPDTRQGAARTDFRQSRAGNAEAGSRLTRARYGAGLTIAELARLLHVSGPTVSLWEAGRRRPVRSLWPALAVALGVHPGEVAELFVGYRPARFDGIRLPSLGRLRRRADITQRHLAEALGVAPTTLSMWECAGVPVPASLIPVIARLLRTDLQQLQTTPYVDATPDRRPLRGFRRAAGLSCKEAAVHLRISVGTLARYEAGERVTPVPVVRRMAAAYRVRVEDVLPHSGVVLAPLPARMAWRSEDVPAAILALRTAVGMTKEELGRALGLSGQAVRGWETGRRRPTSVMYRRLELLFQLPAGRFPA